MNTACDSHVAEEEIPLEKRQTSLMVALYLTDICCCLSITAPISAVTLYMHYIEDKEETFVLHLSHLP